MRELKAERILREIKVLYDELAKHQDKCKHNKATKEPKSNTGNSDPSEDVYWYERKCPTCLKYWTEPQ